MHANLRGPRTLLATGVVAAGEEVTPYVEYASGKANDALDDWNAAGCA